jgi:preprotein translocase subunit YajC
LLNLILMGQPGEGSGGLMGTIIMFGAIFLIFYFMIIRPQQRRAKEREKMLSNIEKGDKVVTSGGIHGIIAGIDEKTVLLQVSETVKLKVDRTAISNILSTKDKT